MQVQPYDAYCKTTKTMLLAAMHPARAHRDQQAPAISEYYYRR